MSLKTIQTDAFKCEYGTPYLISKIYNENSQVQVIRSKCILFLVYNKYFGFHFVVYNLSTKSFNKILYLSWAYPL